MAVIYSRIDSRGTQMVLETVRERILKTTGTLSGTRLRVPVHVHVECSFYLFPRENIFLRTVSGCKSALLVSQTHNSAAGPRPTKKYVHANPRNRRFLQS